MTCADPRCDLPEAIGGVDVWAFRVDTRSNIGSDFMKATGSDRGAPMPKKNEKVGVQGPERGPVDLDSAGALF